jgi:hypothetical protein
MLISTIGIDNILFFENPGDLLSNLDSDIDGDKSRDILGGDREDLARNIDYLTQSFTQL